MIGSNLKHFREQKGLTVNGLSRLSGVAASYISNIENGKKENPSKEVIIKLADSLGRTTDELIHGEIIDQDIEVYLSKISKLSSKSKERIKNIIDAFLEETQD